MDTDLPSNVSKDTGNTDGDEIDGSAGSDTMGSDGASLNESVEAINAYELSEIEADFGYEDLDQAGEQGDEAETYMVALAVSCGSCRVSCEDIEAEEMMNHNYDDP